jgi:hypothetical protein
MKFKSWKFTAIDSGYIDNDLGLEWLRDMFSPLTNPGGKD